VFADSSFRNFRRQFLMDGAVEKVWRISPPRSLNLRWCSGATIWAPPPGGYGFEFSCVGPENHTDCSIEERRDAKPEEPRFKVSCEKPVCTSSSLTPAQPRRTTAAVSPEDVANFASGGSRIMRRSDLEVRHFRGFLPLSQLKGSGCRSVTPEPGVYAVLRPAIVKPTFLSRNHGGRFKGQDPSVEVPVLQRRWVEGTQLLYFGKTDDLKRRIDELCRFGSGEPIGHWGGRYMWQIAGSDEFIIAWLPTSDPMGEHRTLMDEFRAAFGSWPFANILGPQKAGSKRARRIADRGAARPTPAKANDRRRRARNKYKPTSVRCLMIAEAPPTDDRYFYFDDVQTADSLFLETMKVLFPAESDGYARRPHQKRSLLRKFQAAGYWLLDAVDEPLEGAPKSGLRRVEHLRQKSDLMKRLGRLMKAGSLHSRVPIVLIKVTVYDAFHEALNASGYRVIDKRIPFPGSGQQRRFAKAFREAQSCLDR
jgi:hypothetical protein